MYISGAKRLTRSCSRYILFPILAVGFEWFLQYCDLLYQHKMHQNGAVVIQWLAIEQQVLEIMQGDSEENVIILGGDRIGHCKKKILHTWV
jgi:hypothetical protein